ncbi:Protein of unknown function DUF408 [Cinara cedri]|uniref:RNA polymerase II subunit B1 CTD phosphatase RPAP2 homolog n=1 Tax=Cinara cedri TaxID=506608 RepID=A0A5E4MJZ2_9HEMI|nr:Protein of unknown function DUF408 [Cinara cedri]
MDNLKQPKVGSLKNKQKKKISSNNSMSTNALIKKKKECEKKALNIVIELIDGKLEENVLLEKLHLINACHYEDVVEERFILKTCGYVICNQQLTCIPTQQYKISLIKKKVFDITERKKFCSNLCYKSSKYLQSQLLTGPLWIRDTEEIPKFKLYKKVLKILPKDIINQDATNCNGPNKNNNENSNEIWSDEKLQEKVLELKI